MKFKKNDRFWTLTIEPPGVKRKMVYGRIGWYYQSRDAYSVIWDKNTPEQWIKWTNNRMYEQEMNYINLIIYTMKI